MISGMNRSWVNLSFSMISPRLLMLSWWASPNGVISKFGISIASFGRIGMHQPFLNSFSSLVDSIDARSPNADLWLPLKS